MPVPSRYDARAAAVSLGRVSEVENAVRAAEGLSEDGADAAGARKGRVGLDLASTLERIEQSFVITDPSLPDHPIVFASDGFMDFTGYSVDEILGRNCRFLQGPKTDRAAGGEDSSGDRARGRVYGAIIELHKERKAVLEHVHVGPRA